jgi:endonuclease/exonuclease/phosphatase family metal-dependent hydrolase
MPWELVHGRTAGLDVFTTHLAPAPSHGRHRRVQVLRIDEHIRDIRGERDAFLNFPTPRPEMPPILTGDFNAEPGSDEVRFLRGQTVIDDRTTFFQDAWSLAGDGGPGLTQDWRTHPLAAGLNVHLKRIDYVFVGDPFLRAGNGGRILSAAVVANEPLTGVQASDHMGLLVEIEWPTRPL